MTGADASLAIRGWVITRDSSAVSANADQLKPAASTRPGRRYQRSRPARHHYRRCRLRQPKVQKLSPRLRKHDVSWLYSHFTH
jgi:hypothetical protein